MSATQACDDVKPGPPGYLVLGTGHPNPFREATEIHFCLPTAARVRAGVYSVCGVRLKSLADGWLCAGRHRVVWDGTDDGERPVRSGLYFCRLEAPTFSESRKLLLVR